MEWIAILIGTDRARIARLRPGLPQSAQGFTARAASASAAASGSMRASGCCNIRNAARRALRGPMPGSFANRLIRCSTSGTCPLTNSQNGNFIPGGNCNPPVTFCISSCDAASIFSRAGLMRGDTIKSCNISVSPRIHHLRIDRHTGCSSPMPVQRHPHQAGTRLTRSFPGGSTAPASPAFWTAGCCSLFHQAGEGCFMARTPTAYHRKNQNRR